MNGRSKQALRASALAARNRLTADERLRLSEAIAARFLRLDAFSRSLTVALYAAIGGEVETDRIARTSLAAGKRVAYPRVQEAQRSLDFAFCRPDELVAGPHRTRQPPADAPDVALDAIDLVVVPGVAFDERCLRLGRGRGHYDATLARMPPGVTRVGLAFELQLLPEVPRDPHDVSLDAVVTELRILWASAGVREPSTSH